MPQPIADTALDTLFRDARSQNGWLDKPLPEGAPATIWELAVMGPTSANSEPMRVVWCESADAKAKLAAFASEKNAPKILAAPVTAIIGTDYAFTEKLPELFPHDDARAWFAGNQPLIDATAMRNGSLGGAYLMIAARALGYEVGPMSGFDQPGVDAAFFAGTTVRSNFICSIGYGDPDKVYPRLPRLSFDDGCTVL